MRWILRLVEMRTDARSRQRSTDLMEIARTDGLTDIAELGLTLTEAKQLLAKLQQAVAEAQADRHAMLQPNCRFCGGPCGNKDWRVHRIGTLFGGVIVRLRRFVGCGCGHIETGLTWPPHCRSTPELEQLQAHLSALLPYRAASELLQLLLPVDMGTSAETFRSHTLALGKRLSQTDAIPPTVMSTAITVTLDSTFVRGRDDADRKLEVRVGNIENTAGQQRVLGAVTHAETDIAGLIRRNLTSLGRSKATVVTAFTDGCPGLQAVLNDVGITGPPILDWYHIAMRLQHARQTASGLSTDRPRRVRAKAEIIDEVERLRWRIWNGKATDARRSIDRIRRVMHVYKGERGHRITGVASRKLWTALHEIDSYLSGQSGRLVNYAARHRAGLRVGTSITEGAANFLVNHRTNKSQQMRWSRRGADLLLQVRCAIYNGLLGSALGRRFDPSSVPEEQLKMAA
jgi:hypothetical protein